MIAALVSMLVQFCGRIQGFNFRVYLLVLRGHVLFPLLLGKLGEVENRKGANASAKQQAHENEIGRHRVVGNDWQGLQKCCIALGDIVTAGILSQALD